MLIYFAVLKSNRLHFFTADAEKLKFYLLVSYPIYALFDAILIAAIQTHYAVKV